MMDAFSDKIQNAFTAEELCVEVGKLLTAHRSGTVFKLTDYHWLMLYDILYDTIMQHNDGAPTFSGLSIGEIDFDVLVDLYFWDVDFLLSQDEFDAIPVDDKERINFSPEIFGVISGLKPHPSELEMVAIDPPEKTWEPPDYLYEPGGNYPCYSDEGDE